MDCVWEIKCEYEKKKHTNERENFSNYVLPLQDYLQHEDPLTHFSQLQVCFN